MNRAWGIKLGSGGRCIQFCEKHAIVSIGGEMVDAQILRGGTTESLRSHITNVWRFYKTARKRGVAAGQLTRFAGE